MAYLGSPLPAQRVIGLGEGFDELSSIRLDARLLDLLQGRILLSEADVVNDGACKQDGLLRYQTKGGSKPSEVECTYVPPVEHHAPGRWVVESVHELHEQKYLVRRLYESQFMRC